MTVIYANIRITIKWIATKGVHGQQPDLLPSFLLQTIVRDSYATQSVSDNLSLTIARLENRCEALNGNLRVESDAAHAERERATTSERQFERLLIWARQEEGRRLRAEEGVAIAVKRGRTLEEKAKKAEREVRRKKCKRSPYGKNYDIVLYDETVKVNSCRVEWRILPSTHT